MVQVKQISSPEAKKRAYAIRMQVFVREQGVPAEIELDGDDERAIHFLALACGGAVGTARLVIKRGSAKVGRMAVLKSYRRRGVGAMLLRRAVAAAKRRGARRIYLHAQVAVIGFYERFGFRCVGPAFEEAGIAHRKMVLKKATGNGQQSTGKSKRIRGEAAWEKRVREQDDRLRRSAFRIYDQGQWPTIRKREGD